MLRRRDADSTFSSAGRFTSPCKRNCGTDGVEGSRLIRSEGFRCTVEGTARVGGAGGAACLGFTVVVVRPFIVVVPGLEVVVVDLGPAVVVVVVEGGIGVIEESSW